MSDWLDKLHGLVDQEFQTLGDHLKAEKMLSKHARELIDAVRIKRTQSKTIDILNRERSQYAAERDELKDENQRLRESLAALLKFNKELCEDVGVSAHYPSADKARRLLAATPKPNEPETKTVAVPAGEGHEAPIAGVAAMKAKP